MAHEDSPAPPVIAAQATPAAPPVATRRRWGRLLAIVVLIPVAAFALLVVIGMFAPKPKPTDATSVLRELANNPARAAEARIEGDLVETSPLPGPMGLQAEFLWTSGPAGMDAEIYTFDRPMSATGAFEHFNESGSLLVPADDGATRYSVFLTDVKSPAEKSYRCAESSKGFACGSMPAGLPVVVILRRPLETRVERYQSGDPMSAFRQMDQDKARTRAMTSGMIAVDATLQRLGITDQPATN